jgi:hypothetical protein
MSTIELIMWGLLGGGFAVWVLIAVNLMLGAALRWGRRVWVRWTQGDPRVLIVADGWDYWQEEKAQRYQITQRIAYALFDDGCKTPADLVGVLRVWKKQNPIAWASAERVTFVGLLAGMFNAFLPEDLQ